MKSFRYCWVSVTLGSVIAKFNCIFFVNFKSTLKKVPIKLESCALRGPGCLKRPKLAFPWRFIFSFAQMLFNEPTRDFQLDREPSLG